MERLAAGTDSATDVSRGLAPSGIVSRESEHLLKMASWAVAGMRRRGYEPHYLRMHPLDMQILARYFQLFPNSERWSILNRRVRLMGIPVQPDDAVRRADVVAQFDETRRYGL